MKTNIRWVIRIVLVSMAVSMTLTFVSGEILGGAGYIAAFGLLFLFIFIGIITDVIGVAVMSASLAPFHSMAAHKRPGAVEAIRLIRNAEKVSSICNDIFGDICGIISGSMSALIIARLMIDLSTENMLFQLFISAAVTGLTIGGKALGKTVAINSSTRIVFNVGLVISFFRRIFKKKRG